MIRNCAALAKRLFPERQFLLRSGEKVRYLLLPGWMQAAGLAAVLALVVGVGGLAGAYHHAHKAMHEKEAEANAAAARVASLANLRQSLAQADNQYTQMSQQFEEAKAQLDAANADNDTLRDSIAGAEARVAVMDKTRLQLEQRLDVAEKALVGKSGNVSQLAQELAASRSELRVAEQSRNDLEGQLQKLQADSATTTTRTSQLKESLAMREQELQQIATERSRIQTQISQQDSVAASAPSHGYVGELEQLVASTGLDLTRYLGTLHAPTDEGGPFIPLDPRREAQRDNEVQKQLEALVKTLPLAAPLVHYTVTSPYGPRVDPFNHRPAFHAGIDFAAPYKTPVLATAPGVVTYTGWRGAYGRLVEVSHGHGIVTRYSHLHRILVAVGQKVTLHQEVGELGSTGRSTGPHVYYEVLVDGTQVDPEKFLDAGKSVELISATK